jgi:Putative auto-transporter adhesin, head GIN domain
MNIAATPHPKHRQSNASALCRIGMLLAASGALLLASCGDISISIGDDKVVNGSGVRASETRAVTAFTSVDASGVGNMKLRIGDADSLKITADDNLLPKIKSEVKDGVLILSSTSALHSKTDIVYEITAKSIQRIENSGTVSIDASGFNGGALKIETSGVGSTVLAGKVDSLKVELSGVGSIDADRLVADRVVAEMSGVGSGSVRAEKSIRAEVSGVGSLSWKGAATEVSTSVSGIGRVSKS